MVRIITDTLSCIPTDFAQQYDIPVIPQIINFGEESFREGIDMDHKTFLKRLRSSSVLPKTAAPAPEWFFDAFKRLVPTGEPILCIHPTADMSGTVRSATVARQDFPDADIRIIDTRLIASPLGFIVMAAAKWAAAGLDADTIVARVEGMSSRCVIFFMVDTLEYLARGGRIGNASALLGSILQIKPILTLKDGKTDVYQKERTHKRAVEHIKARVHEQYAGQGEDFGFLHILHSDALDEAKVLAEEFKTEYHLDNVPVIDLPPAVITHGGPGMLGISYFLKES